MSDADTAVELGVAGKPHLNSGHADQDQAGTLSIEHGAEIYEGSCGKALGLVNDDELDMAGTAVGRRTAWRSCMLVHADIDNWVNNLSPPLLLRNEMQNRYGKLASWVYNLDKPIGRSFGDQEYYRERLKQCDGGPILEPAVGNGRTFVPLLEAGFPIEGFDASDEMLDYCRDECRKRNLSASLTRQTFEQFSYDKSFAAIIVPAGSFQLVTNLASAGAVLKRFYDYLAPNGRLIVDLDPIGSFLGPSGSVRTWMTEDGDLLTLTDHRVETNYIAQTTLSHLRYEHWQGGNLMTTELDLFKLRWWGVNEFSLALRAAGFTDVVVSGNYQHGQEPQKDDEIISFEGRRPATG